MSSNGFNILVGRIDDNFYDLNEKDAADFLNKIIEQLVDQNISQYLWSYERFRNRTGVEETIY